MLLVVRFCKRPTFAVFRLARNIYAYTHPDKTVKEIRNTDLKYRVATSMNNRESTSSIASVHRTKADPNRRKVVTLFRWKIGYAMHKYLSTFSKNNVTKEMAIKLLAINSTTINDVHSFTFNRVCTVSATTPGLPKRPIVRSFSDNKAIRKYDFFSRNFCDRQ